MTILIGLAPGERGTPALSLGSMLARSAGEDVVVAIVVPTPWPPNPYRIDDEYLEQQEALAAAALDRAKSVLGADLTADLVVHRARSVSAGLLELATDRSVSYVVLGSSPAGGLGRVTLGGVGHRVLHSAEVPVAIAPLGLVAAPDARVGRITVAFGRADGDSDLLRSASAAADRSGASLRVACFAVRPLNALGGGLKEAGEDLVVEQWTSALLPQIERALDGSDGGVATQVDLVVGRGSSWSEALMDVPWAATDVLAIGTSSAAMARFTLGSHAAKIVRSAPTPVVLIPRAVTADL